VNDFSNIGADGKTVNSNPVDLGERIHALERAHGPTVIAEIAASGSASPDQIRLARNGERIGAHLTTIISTAVTAVETAHAARKIPPGVGPAKAGSKAAEARAALGATSKAASAQPAADAAAGAPEARAEAPGAASAHTTSDAKGEPAESAAGIPFLITNAMKAALRDKGFSNDDIANMKPGDAHKLLSPDPHESFPPPVSPPAEPVSSGDREAAGEPDAKTTPPSHGKIRLTLTRRASGGFIGKRLLDSNGKFETLCAGKDFIDETVDCTDLDHVAAVIGERADAGRSAISLGTPARNPSGPHSHEAFNYRDTPTRLFFIDADGVFAKGLGRADRFEEAAKFVICLMGEAFKGVAYVALRTTRTGSDKDRIFIRFLFLLDAPATLVQMGAVAAGLGELPGFTRGIAAPKKTTIDAIHREGHFVFIASPQCAPGVTDPTAGVGPVNVEGDTLDLNAAATGLGIDLANPPRQRRTTRAPGAVANNNDRISPITPGVRNQKLLTALLHSIPNDEKFNNRSRAGATTDEGTYIGMAHAWFGACSNEPAQFSRREWMEWASKWPASDPKEDERVWDTLNSDGDNGFWDLMDYARAFGGPAGLKARSAILIETFPEISAEQLDDLARGYAGAIPDWVIEMNAKYAFSEDRPSGVIVRGDDNVILKMITRQELRNTFANDLVQVGKDKNGKPRLVNKGDAWFSHRARAQYRAVGSYPVGQEPPGTQNLWKGLATARKPGEWPRLKAFLLGTTCNGEQAAFDYLLKLMQWKIQNPTENPEVAIIQRGGEGVGKNTLFYILECIFGAKWAVTYTDPDAATAKFNADAEGKQLIHYDETHFGHDHRAAGRLKGGITGKTVRVEPKGINAYHVKNTALRIYSSNEAAAVPISLDARRFLVLDLSSEHQNDLEYYKALREALDDGELAAFVGDALAADLKTFELDRRTPYKTEARARLAEATASTEDAYLLELLHRGRGIGGVGWDARPWKQGAPDLSNPWWTGDILVARDAVHDDYVGYVQANYRGVRVRNAAELHDKIQKVLGKTLFKWLQARIPGDRASFRLIGPLAECRAAYDRHTGATHDWSDIASSGAANTNTPPGCSWVNGVLYNDNHE
jgi:Family of unknown function (DUF5906)